MAIGALACTPMSDSVHSASGRDNLLTRKGMALLLAGIVTIGLGYGVLASGAAGPAAFLLVVGYVVLVPVSLVV